MASKIERLPTEILEPILLDLTISDVSKLRRCTKFFHECLEAFICRLPFANHKLMRWGCVEGEKWAIEKALSYGADISLIEVQSPTLVGPEGPVIFKVSTLYLALRQLNYEIFHFLLDSGACLDAVNADYSLDRKFRKRFFHPKGYAFLQQCMDRGFHENIELFRDGINKALVSAIKQDLGLETYQGWLDLGADPTALISRSHRLEFPESALSLAILSGSVPLTRLLVAKKPNFDMRVSLEKPKRGVKPSPPWRVLPMLAAARRMATHGETEFLDILIEAGGDINWPCLSFLYCLEPLSHQSKHAFITPIMVYIFSTRLNARVWGIHFPISHGLLYLLDRGAVIRGGFFWFGLCWETWGCEIGLLNDEAHHALQILIQNGGAKGHVSAFLSSTATFNPFKQLAELSPVDSQTVNARWRTLLGLLLRDENFNSTLSQEIDGLLYNFLSSMFINLNWPDGFSSQYSLEMIRQYSKECNLVTIQTLLGKGANINSANKTTGRCILDHFFHENKSESFFSYKPLERISFKRQCSFANALIRLGANPPEVFRKDESKRKGYRGMFYTSYVKEQIEKKESVHNKWVSVFRGELPEEERLLWNPYGGPLMDGTWKPCQEEEESPRVFTLPEYLQRKESK